MYNCLKDSWITLKEFEKKYSLTRWQAIKLAAMLPNEYKEKIGTVNIIYEPIAKGLID